jgi:hypothetical protein
MNRISSLLCLCLCTVIDLSTQYTVTLGDVNEISLSVNEDGKTLDITATVPNGQWFGVGIGSSMFGADIWLFDAASDEASISDTYVNGHAYPEEDDEQDLTTVSITTSDTHTVFVASRLLDSADETGDDVDIEMNTDISMIYAYKEGDLGYHGYTQRGFWSFYVDSSDNGIYESSAMVASPLVGSVMTSDLQTTDAQEVTGYYPYILSLAVVCLIFVGAQQLIKRQKASQQDKNLTTTEWPLLSSQVTM